VVLTFAGRFNKGPNYAPTVRREEGAGSGREREKSGEKEEVGGEEDRNQGDNPCAGTPFKSVKRSIRKPDR